MDIEEKEYKCSMCNKSFSEQEKADSDRRIEEMSTIKDVIITSTCNDCYNKWIMRITGSITLNEDRSINIIEKSSNDFWGEVFNFNKTKMDIEEAEKQGYVPVKEFAEKKGVTVQAVYMGIKAKRFQSKKVGSFTFVKE